MRFSGAGHETGVEKTVTMKKEQAQARQVLREALPARALS
jgi:hypothetical protein